MQMMPKAFVFLLSLLMLAGCKTPEEREAERAQQAAVQEAKKKEEEAQAKAAQDEIRSKLPADSPLQKINFGMSEAEVGSALGPPTSQWTRPTGKAFIPFNYSRRDTMRTTYLYKAIGRVEFSSGSWGQRNGVVNLIHDPNEPGQEAKK